MTDEQQGIIAALEHRLGASEAQLLAFFRIIGDAQVAPERIGERLIEIAERYKGLLVQAEARPGDDPVVARLRAAAHTALEQGDLGRADTLFSEVEQEQDAALDRQALDAAATRAQRGEIALTRLRYREAAAHFAAAAARVPSEQPKQRLFYLGQDAAALYHQGVEF